MSSIPGEALLFSLLLGAGLGVLYAIIRTVCILLSLGKIVTALADILFCLAVSAATFILALAVSHGQLRFFQAGCQVIGFCCVKSAVVTPAEKGLRFCVQRIDGQRKKHRKSAVAPRFLKKKSRNKEKTLE